MNSQNKFYSEKRFVVRTFRMNCHGNMSMFLSFYFLSTINILNETSHVFFYYPRDQWKMSETNYEQQILLMFLRKL